MLRPISETIMVHKLDNDSALYFQLYPSLAQRLSEISNRLH